MDVKIYNSLTNKLEKFVPLVDNKVSMYVCGPTVYSYPHIGNLRPVISFDVVRRLFERLGYDVTHISNITDIDDKIINAAIENKCTEKEITDKYNTYFSNYLNAHKMNKITLSFEAAYMETVMKMFPIYLKMIEKSLILYSCPEEF